MLPDERTWTNPRTGAWLTWRREDDGVSIERVMKPHTGKADPHRHLNYLERFEVLDGTPTFEVEGRRFTAGAGERVEVPLGAPHRNPFNETDSDVHLRHFAPDDRFSEAFVSALGHHTENDTVNDQGEFSNLQLFVVLHATRAQSFRAGIPIPVQKPVIALGAAIGRMRGLRPSYD